MTIKTVRSTVVLVRGSGCAFWPLHMRSLVPALPLLTSLGRNKDLGAKDRVEGESLTVDLLARLPLLKPDDYDRTVDQTRNGLIAPRKRLGLKAIPRWRPSHMNI